MVTTILDHICLLFQALQVAWGPCPSHFLSSNSCPPKRTERRTLWLFIIYASRRNQMHHLSKGRVGMCDCLTTLKKQTYLVVVLQEVCDRFGPEPYLPSGQGQVLSSMADIAGATPRVLSPSPSKLEHQYHVSHLQGMTLSCNSFSAILIISVI